MLRCRRGIATRQGRTLRRAWPPGLRRRRGRLGIRDVSMRIGSFSTMQTRGIHKLQELEKTFLRHSFLG